MGEGFTITDILTQLGNVVAWIWGLFGDIFEIIKATPLLFVFFALPIVVAAIFGAIRLINKFKKG